MDVYPYSYITNWNVQSDGFKNCSLKFCIVPLYQSWTKEYFSQQDEKGNNFFTDTSIIWIDNGLSCRLCFKISSKLCQSVLDHTFCSTESFDTCFNVFRTLTHEFMYFLSFENNWLFLFFIFEIVSNGEASFWSTIMNQTCHLGMENSSDFFWLT